MFPNRCNSLLLFVFRYDVVVACWMVDPNRRPKFSELHLSLQNLRNAEKTAPTIPEESKHPLPDAYLEILAPRYEEIPKICGEYSTISALAEDNTKL